MFEDANSNGIQDDGKPGISGFPVQLTGTDLDNNPIDLSTTTDADGRYRFPGLASGTYRVTFSPAGLTNGSTCTQQNAADGDDVNDDTADSDGDPANGHRPPATGQTATFPLAPPAPTPPGTKESSSTGPPASRSPNGWSPRPRPTPNGTPP